MRIQEKIRVLSGAAKYDVSCASSGSSRVGKKNSVGNTSVAGICHSWSSDGRCISLLKILMSNDCQFDCAYCSSRRSNNIERATFTVEEMVKITIGFYRRNYIEGLFLSSAIYSTPEKTMSDMVDIAVILREKHHFNGYIHLKVIPGVSAALLRKAAKFADRLSVNIELPTEKSLNYLAPQKQRDGIIKPMSYLGQGFRYYNIEQKKRKDKPGFIPAGQSTQMIVGASQESDQQILKLSESLYNKFTMKRVYYSAYVPVNSDNRLPILHRGPELLREHRLYQADWLFRFYRFQIDELLNSQNPHLDLNLDPKAAWALRNFHLFPVDINHASYEMLLRIPGVGVRSAQKIVSTRKVTRIREEDLHKIGFVMRRAKYFITINGKYPGDIRISDPYIRYALTESTSSLIISDSSLMYQPSLFEEENTNRQVAEGRICKLLSE